MSSIMLKSRPLSMTVRCSSQKTTENPINIARKRFETKRVVSLKENINRLIAIANSDVKEYGEFFNELDDIHKKQFTEVFDHIKDKIPTGASKSSDKSSEENIFLE